MHWYCSHIGTLEKGIGVLYHKSQVLPVSLSFDDEGILVMEGKATYELRYFFAWGGGCLWPGNDAIRRDFGDLGPYDLREPCPLPLSLATKARCRALTEWYDTSLNSKYPLDPAHGGKPNVTGSMRRQLSYWPTSAGSLGQRFGSLTASRNVSRIRNWMCTWRTRMASAADNQTFKHFARDS